MPVEFLKTICRLCNITCFLFIGAITVFAQTTCKVAYKYENYYGSDNRTVNTFHFDNKGFSYEKGEYSYKTPVSIMEITGHYVSLLDNDTNHGYPTVTPSCTMVDYVEVVRDGNIYTYPCGGRFPGQKISLYAEGKEYQPNAYYNIHGRNYQAGAVEMNTILIDGRANTINNCFNNLDWGKVRVLIPRHSISYGNDVGLMTYSVVYDSKVPRDVWDNAMRIKSAFPGFLAEDYVDEMYGSFQQAVISKIDRNAIRVTQSVTLMGLAYPVMSYTQFRDNKVLLLCYEKGKGNTDCEITPQNPLYFINANDFNIEYVFTPKEGEHFTWIQQASPGQYLLFGSTTQQGYIGYNNPMIVSINVGLTESNKIRRWTYPTPRKGYYRKVLNISDKQGIIYVETVESSGGGYVSGLHQEYIHLNSFIAGLETGNKSESLRINYSELSIDSLLKKANNEDARAQNQLGYRYDYGKGVPQDYEEAAKWYRKAAENGSASAQFNLGLYYQKGKGVPQDIEEAVKWYRKSAEQGIAAAQCNLGWCYESGKGVPQDYEEAAKWYRKAAEHGDADGQYNLGVCYESGRGVTQDYVEAVRWYQKAAEQGLADAQYKLGYCYSNGRGVTQDYSEAVKWYRKAAEQGNALGQSNLGFCYSTGRGVTRDYSEAVKWYRKAAEQGYSSAQYKLGSCYEEGKGVSQDYSEAVKWYRKAAEQGNEKAKKKLESLR